MDTKWLKNSFIYLLIGVALIALVLTDFGANGSRQPSSMSLSEVIEAAKAGQIKKIAVQGDTLIVDRNDTNVEARVQTDPNANIYQIFESTGVPQSQISKIATTYPSPPSLGTILALLIQLPPSVFP